MVKNLPAKAGDLRDMGLIPVLGRSLGKGNVFLQYSCLENCHGQESGGLQSRALQKVGT